MEKSTEQTKVIIMRTHSYTRLKSLPKDHIFVFGSNESGYHGAGAARDAVTYFKAIYKQGIGHQGQAYALPTKGKMENGYLATLSLERIDAYIKQFFQELKPELTYVITEVGCGLAGYKVSQIAPLFYKHWISFESPNNMIFPNSFKQYFKEFDPFDM